MKQAFINWCESRCNRPPDKVILRTDGSVYMRRWWVIPRNRIFNIYLHDFVQSDDDRALHDHPWFFNASIIVRGMYKEITKRGIDIRYKGDFKFRWGKAPHRVELFAGMYNTRLSCRTIFITGPVRKQVDGVAWWGFYCPKGWVHWTEFTKLEDGVSTISKGCD